MFCDGYDNIKIRSGCFDFHEYNKITMNHDEIELLFTYRIANIFLILKFLSLYTFTPTLNKWKIYNNAF